MHTISGGACCSSNMYSVPSVIAQAPPLYWQDNMAIWKDIHINVYCI